MIFSWQHLCSLKHVCTFAWISFWIFFFFFWLWFKHLPLLSNHLSFPLHLPLASSVHLPFSLCPRVCGLGAVGDACSAVQVRRKEHHRDVSGQWHGSLAAKRGIGRWPERGASVWLTSAGGRSHSAHQPWVRLPGWSLALPLQIEEPDRFEGWWWTEVQAF